MLEDLAVVDGDVGGNVPGDGEGDIAEAVGFPDVGEVGGFLLGGEFGFYVHERAFFGQLGSELGVEINDIRAGVSGDRRQNFVFHFTPRHVHPFDARAGVLLLEVSD